MEKEQYFTFIVLHYNCFEETKACVDSILALEQSEQTQIVVMDNASVNDSLAGLKQTYGDNPQVHILQTERDPDALYSPMQYRSFRPSQSPFLKIPMNFSPCFPYRYEPGPMWRSLLHPSGLRLPVHTL